MRLLIVDDHSELLDLVKRALTSDGHQVTGARSLAEARAHLAVNVSEVLILDVALPDGTGLDLCRELRRAGDRVPILLLTAHGEIPQRVAGLDAGADDFLPKPFAVAELRARVRALGRRGPLDRAAFVCVGSTELDLSSRRAQCAGAEVPLTTREWAVLELLAARAGRVVTRAEILDVVWGEQSESGKSSLEVIIARIRRKLGPELVRTLRGEGYALGRG
jgi:DNA-binding response OmpR family regulator